MESFHLTPPVSRVSLLFFFNDSAPPEIYTLSLHDALPIRPEARYLFLSDPIRERLLEPLIVSPERSDRKSTRLNSSHANISYAVFCLKKKSEDPPHPHERS